MTAPVPTCLGCGVEVGAGGEGCVSCGVQFPARCGACGQPVQPAFVYCPACGDAIGTSERQVALASSFHRLREQMPAGLAEKVLATRGRIEGERKQVAVLFCDLVSSATIAEAMDPEEFRDLLDRYLAVVFDEVARAEGLVNQIAGDGVMALFGAPLAHEDAPVRAVQAAIAIRDGLVALSDSLRGEGRPALTARIGLNTGPVIVGTVGGDLKLDYTAIGDTTNLAARMQSLARPGAILVSESLERLVSEHFQLRPLGPQTIRGRALPVAVFEVEHALATKTPLSGRVSRSELFIGREEEIGALEAAFADASRGRGQAVGIVGHAGVGASRLVTELVRRLDERTSRIFWGQCFSYTQRAAYRPFVGLLWSHFAPEEGDAARVALQLPEVLAGAVEAPDVAAAVLGRLLGLEGLGDTSLEGDELRLATVDAVAGLLLAESRHDPLVLVLEDAQWIDGASKELLNVLLERARSESVLVVCTYRPDSPTPWTPHSDVQEIELASLTREQSREIVCTIAGGEVPPEVVAVVHDRASGNPFFTEEVTRELLETGVLVPASDGSFSARSLSEAEVLPVTVYEIVAARLDRLPVEEKRVLQVAAVMGRHFSAALVEQLLARDGIDVGARLDALRRAGVVSLSTSGAAHDYVFEQALTQEVAYQGLLLKQRRQLHAEIAEALESRYEGSLGEHSAILAYHFKNGERHQKALDHLLDAAAHADGVPSYGTAAHLYRQAWELARRNVGDDDGARRALYAGTRILWLAALFGEGTEVVVEGMGEEIADLLDRVGTAEDRIAATTFQGLLQVFGAAEQHVSGLQRLVGAMDLAHHEGHADWSWRVRRGLCIGYALDGRFDEASRMADEVLAEVSASDDAKRASDRLLWARASRDAILLYRDELDEALVQSKETFELSAKNRTVRITTASQVATVLLLRGEAEQALTWAQEGLALAAAVASRSNVPNLAAIAVLAGRSLDEPIDEARLLRQIENDLTGAAGVQQSLRFATDAFLAAGQVERAERVAQGVRRRAGGRLRQAQSACDLGAVALNQGHHGWKRADYFLDEAVRVARGIGARSSLARALALRAELLAARGDEETSERCVAESAKLAHEIGVCWLAQSM